MLTARAIVEEGLAYDAAGKLLVEAAREKRARVQRNRLTAMARRRKEAEQAVGYKEGLFGQVGVSSGGVAVGEDVIAPLTRHPSSA